MLEGLTKNSLVELSVTYRGARVPAACRILAATARLGFRYGAVERLVRYAAVKSRMYVSLLLLYFYVPDRGCMGA